MTKLTKGSQEAKDFMEKMRNARKGGPRKPRTPKPAASITEPVVESIHIEIPKTRARKSKKEPIICPHCGK
jgi:hypothetical protein